MSKKRPEIYDMNLHERINLEGMSITRVAGGWIYETQSMNCSVSLTFVPFDNEFLSNEEKYG